MAFPIAALLGFGGSLISGGLGAMAQSEAANQNYAINLLNYYSREKERRQSIQAQRQATQDNKLGTTDAYGNRTHFVEGKGWVTDLDPKQQALQDIQYDEQLQSAVGDTALRRKQTQQNYGRQQVEGDVADSFLRQMEALQPTSTDSDANLLYGQAARGINDAFDKTQAAAMRSSLRSGASNTGQILADLARSRSAQLADASTNSYLQAKQNAGQDYAQKRGQLAQLYNAFASAARQSPDITYNPVNTAAGTLGTTNALMNLQSGANNQLAAAYARQGGTMDYVEPQMGWANALSQGTQALVGGMNQYNGEQANQRAQDLMMQYLQNGGDLSRLRASAAQGAF